MDDMEHIFDADEQVFVHACFLPPRKTNVIMKPGIGLDDEFSYKTFFIKPRIKSVPINLKLVKKVEIKKLFYREQSVFSDYKAETKSLYKKCFDYDIKFSKLNRVIKDPKEVSG